MRSLLCLLCLVVAIAATPLPKLFFQIVDTDNDGVISPKELADFSFKVDKGSFVDEPNARKVIAWLDKDNDNSIDLKEFCEMANDSCEDDDENAERKPEQIHLAPGATENDIVVSWVVLGKEAMSISSTAVVEFGTNAKNMSIQTSASAATYDCGVPKWEGASFHATLSALTPGETYWYRVGNTAANSYSDTKTFTVPSVSAKLPMRFAVFGDVGTVIPAGFLVAKQLARLHAEQPFDSMVHVGDIAYAGVSSEKYKEVPFVWDMYGRQMAPVAENIPYITGIGNHEKYCNYSSFQARYYMPGYLQGGVGNFWFSVDRGLVHWLSMSTEHDYFPGSPQYQFLEADLERAVANRVNVPWIVLIGHRPMYSSDADEKDQHWPGASIQSNIEPLMNKYKVDMYIGGHMHCYERIHPIIANGTVDKSSIHGNVYLNPNGAVHVVQGTGGSWEREKWIDPQPDWSVSRMQHYGIGDMIVHNATTIQYAFLQIEGKKLDEFFLVKEAPK